MHLRLASPVLAVAWAATVAAASSPWTVHVANDNCPDYTWGLTEEATRQAFADIVRSHLDEMTRTDDWPEGSRDRYNATATQEILCFLEKYPDRRAELFRRMREGRLFVSPFLCNSIWGFQSAEAFLRTLYPARRLEAEAGVRFDAAEHIELPSLPWGVATLLSGAGVKWLSVPFYNYDSSFGSLTNPPIFEHVGPDGARVRVVMDPWACNSASYQQGKAWMQKPRETARTWIPHFEALGDAYFGRAILASGTHSDISLTSGAQARGFADALRAADEALGAGGPRVVNAALPQFFRAVDEAVAARGVPLPAMRGCFGHSWDTWPVGLAATVAAAREGERRFLAAESMLALAGGKGDDRAVTERRHRAEWCWAMLSDHAWNGTDATNKRLNAELRQRWAAELNAIAGELTAEAWSRAGREASDRIAVFHPVSFGAPTTVRLAVGDHAIGPWTNAGAQVSVEDGVPMLTFAAEPESRGFAFHEFAPTNVVACTDVLQAGVTGITNQFHRLVIDPARAAIVSLAERESRYELLAGEDLAGVEYFDGAKHALTDGRVEVLASGPVFARVRMTGRCGPLFVTNDVTMWSRHDRVDIDLRVERPSSMVEDRLLIRFPVLRPGATLLAETGGAVVRPAPQPAGDLLPGADPRRFAVQYDVRAETTNGTSISVVTLDAFLLRPTEGGITFEAFGSDQNHREALLDQGGARQFRFRFAIASPGWPGITCRETVMAPVCRWGGVRADAIARSIAICAGYCVATCLKPADEGPARGIILRVWSPDEGYGGFSASVSGLRAANRTDLLERDGAAVECDGDTLTVPMSPFGLSSVRLFLKE